jgi:hypothetical protein
MEVGGQLQDPVALPSCKEHSVPNVRAPNEPQSRHGSLEKKKIVLTFLGFELLYLGRPAHNLITVT